MNNLTEESGLGDCLICFSKIENYDALLPGQESQKIVDSCCNYLYENIANSKLHNVKSENGNELPLCKKCFDAASELMELSEVVLKSEKKISNLSFEFSLGVLARRTQVQSVNNLPDGQNSAKEFIVLDVSRISPSLFSTDQPNPSETDDFAHPCEKNFIGMDAALNDPQHIFEIGKHEPEDAVEESAESENDTNISKDEELPAHTQTVVVLKKLKEAEASEKCNSKCSTQQLPSNASRLNHQFRNGTSKKKIVQPSSSNIIHGKTGSRNLKTATKSVSSMKTDRNVVTGKKEHKCQECGKVFATSSDLHKHIRVHTGERPYKCLFCVKTFSLISNRKAHLRIHTGERPFKCSLCAKTFVYSSDVKRHERIHSGEKPFKCLHCSKAFAHSNTLKFHLRVHAKEKTS